MHIVVVTILVTMWGVGACNLRNVDSVYRLICVCQFMLRTLSAWKRL